MKQVYEYENFEKSGSNVIGMSWPFDISIKTNMIGYKNYVNSYMKIRMGIVSMIMNNIIPKYQPLLPNVFLSVSV